MRQPFPAVLLVLLSALLGCAAWAQESVTETLLHDGLERDYYLHVPEGADGEPWPLVVVLHGRGGDGPGMARLTDFDAIADEHGFIAVYPSGVEEQWNYLEDVLGYNLEADDVGFLRSLVTNLSERYSIEPTRVYVTGFSNGGFMAQRLICEAPDLFAAFASVAAAGFGGLPQVCDDPQPVALLFIHGTSDAIIPFEGLSQQGPNGPVVVLASVADTLSFWSAYAGCGGEGSSRSLPQRGLSMGTDVRVFTLSDCPEGSELELYIVRGGGHNWPGQPGKIPEQIAGAVNQDFDAGEVIWAFFERHPKEGS